MRKKNIKLLVLITVICLIFPFIVKVLSLNLFEIVLCIMFYGMLKDAISHFNIGVALPLRSRVLSFN